MRTSRIKIIACLIAVCISLSARSFGQSTEAQQLLLNVEKLTQLKSILKDMKKGYSIIANGYNAVRNISQGNFSLHESFLDGLMMVSPEVRKYARVADIITAQKDILSEYKRSLKNFQLSGLLNGNELDYLTRVHSGLFSLSMDNLDELTLVLTAGSLRMSDDERLACIDRIFTDTSDKLAFLRSFNAETGALLLQRKNALIEMQGTTKLFKIR